MTATHINYLHVCERKLWLFGNGVQMEHTSHLVADGKLLGETAYPQRAAKYTELQLGSIKIDYYDAKNKIIHEIKRTPAMEEAHLWQVRFYIYMLEKAGIEGVGGRIEYPKLRQVREVSLTQPDREYLEEILPKIETIVGNPSPPQLLKNKRICNKCAYRELCFC